MVYPYIAQGGEHELNPARFTYKDLPVSNYRVTTENELNFQTFVSAKVKCRNSPKHCNMKDLISLYCILYVYSLNFITR